MNIKTTFQCSADLANLPTVRNFIRESAMQVCADEDFQYDLMLAADEVVTNIILHGYRGEPGTIFIETQSQPGGLRVTIKDNAPLFDPHTVPTPKLDLPLDERNPGGLGILLVRSLMDGMIYTPGAASGNELTLIKYCPGEGNPEEQS
jgi:serine/threonine-protein kinase RsbW